MRNGQRRRRDEGSVRFTRQCRPDPRKIHPYRILDFGRVKRKRRIIRLPDASNHQRGWKGPGLARNITHAVDATTRLLPQLPRPRFLDRLSWHAEPRQRCKSVSASVRARRWEDVYELARAA